MAPSVKSVKAFRPNRDAASIPGVSVRTAPLWPGDGHLQVWKSVDGLRRIARDSIDHLRAVQPVVLRLNERPAREKLIILVVEDDLQVLRLYEKNMDRWPMQPVVLMARNGTEAMVRIGMTRPDLMVIDLNMPEMNGFQMLDRIVGIPELATTSIVAVTGLDAEAIAERGGLPHGVTVLAKPIPFERLRHIATVLADRK